MFSDRADRFPARAALVTLRAVEDFDRALPVAARLLASAGRLALLIGGAQLARAQELLPDLAWDPPLAVPQSASRIVLLSKGFSG